VIQKSWPAWFFCVVTGVVIPLGSVTVAEPVPSPEQEPTHKSPARTSSTSTVVWSPDGADCSAAMKVQPLPVEAVVPPEPLPEPVDDDAEELLELDDDALLELLLALDEEELLELLLPEDDDEELLALDDEEDEEEDAALEPVELPLALEVPLEPESVAPVDAAPLLAAALVEPGRGQRVAWKSLGMHTPLWQVSAPLMQSLSSWHAWHEAVSLLLLLHPARSRPAIAQHASTPIDCRVRLNGCGGRDISRPRACVACMLARPRCSVRAARSILQFSVRPGSDAV